MALRTFNVLPICAGYGGLDLGIKLAVPGARCVAYVEGEAHAAATLIRRMEETFLDDAPIWSNARTFDGRPWRGLVDCVSGGYPCQPHSVAGRKLGEADPRYLWPDIKRIVEEVSPEWCFFENVGNHLRSGFRIVRDDLRSLGYHIAAGLFTAEEIGATHVRERLFIMAHAQRPERRAGNEGRGCSLQGTDREGQAASTLGRGSEALRCDSGAKRRRVVFRFDERSLESLEKLREQGRMPDGIDRICTIIVPVLANPFGEHRQRRREPGKLAGPPRQEHRDPSERKRHGNAVDDRSNGLAERSLFPPGPADLDAWSEVLRLRPDLEPARSKPSRRLLKQCQRYLEARTEEERATFKPAVRRVAHGMANRVDRLRGCGNGVVPLEAAHAWLTLHDALAD